MTTPYRNKLLDMVPTNSGHWEGSPVDGRWVEGETPEEKMARINALATVFQGRGVSPEGWAWGGDFANPYGGGETGIVGESVDPYQVVKKVGTNPGNFLTDRGSNTMQGTYNPATGTVENESFHPADGWNFADLAKMGAFAYGGMALQGAMAGGAAAGTAGATAAELAAATAADTAAGLIPAGEAGAATLAGGGTGVVGNAIAGAGSLAGTVGATAEELAAAQAADQAAGLIPAGQPGAATLAGGGAGVVGSGLGTTAGTGAGILPEELASSMPATVAQAATTAGTAASAVDPWLKIAGLIAPIGSAIAQSIGANSAADAQAKAASDALALQQKQFDATAPWRNAGEASLNKLMGLLNDGSLTKTFPGMNPTEEAGYAFAAKEGQRAIDNSASARGGIGGAALKAGSRFAEDNANKFYNDSFNRFQTEKTNTTNPLFQIAGFGPQANQQAQVATDNMSGLNLYGGAANAKNDLAQGNIYGTLINQLGAWWNPPKTPGT